MDIIQLGGLLLLQKADRFDHSGGGKATLPGWVAVGCGPNCGPLPRVSGFGSDAFRYAAPAIEADFNVPDQECSP